MHHLKWHLALGPSDREIVNGTLRLFTSPTAHTHAGNTNPQRFALVVNCISALTHLAHGRKHQLSNASQQKLPCHVAAKHASILIENFSRSYQGKAWHSYLSSPEA
jgi:hypothetical protein